MMRDEMMDGSMRMKEDENDLHIHLKHDEMLCGQTSRMMD
jgi:hypothetical protein